MPGRCRRSATEVAVDALERAVTNHEPVVEGLRALTVPVVQLNSDYFPTDVDGLRGHGVKAVFQPGVGHFLMMEKPDEFNRLLGHAIDEVSSVDR
jgi:pimeloyl-ACP methyl ester carboxylesterase